MATKLDASGVRIAERLRLERESRSWTLGDVAERSGVARATISKIERGEASPTANVLVRPGPWPKSSSPRTFWRPRSTPTVWPEVRPTPT